jgi:peptidoglycan/LPS O-acetylase OafA/YrhL
MENNNNRIIGIDILKVFAVLLVLNSHMSMCYDGIEHPFWVTGEGAIGNALFFFSSGFTLFLGDKQLPSFANWYKRRVNRIIPTILSVVIIVCIFRNFSYVMRYWFVECILVYYVFFYPIRRFSFLSNHLNRVFMGAAVAILLIYLLAFNYTNKSLFYGHDDFRRYFFFLYMLQGAIMGKQYALYKFKGWHVLMLFVCVAVWYALCIVFKNSQWQINYGYSTVWHIILHIFGVVCSFLQTFV